MAVLKENQHTHPLPPPIHPRAAPPLLRRGARVDPAGCRMVATGADRWGGRGAAREVRRRRWGSVGTLRENGVDVGLYRDADRDWKYTSRLGVSARVVSGTALLCRHSFVCATTDVMCVLSHILTVRLGDLVLSLSLYRFHSPALTLPITGR